jgi:hypothetical protein
MIKKTLLFTILFFIVYCVFVAWLAPKWWTATQNTEQDNIIKAQNFAYNDTAFKYIVVGSSLSARIVQDSLPNTSNLAFVGQSIFDGLNILSHKQTLPKVVLIEMNLVFRQENKAFTSPLYSPLIYYPKKQIKALRDDKEPLAVAGKIILNGIYFTKNFIRGHQFIAKRVAADTAAKQNDIAAPLSNKMLPGTYQSFYKIPNSTEVDEAFKNLKAYTDVLQKKGVKIVFFEMPVDKRLGNLPLSVFVRTRFYANYPKTLYHYISLPNWNYCETTDGIHLTGQAAIRYTAYLKSQLPDKF